MAKSEEISDYFNDARSEMLPIIPIGVTIFLEVGCGAGAFGESILRKIPNSHVTGIEVHQEASKLARARLSHVIEKPVELALEEIHDHSIDCVILNDVIEHLVDPWAILKTLKIKLKDNGYVVASIPNVRYFPVLREYLSGDWRYQECGVMDRTHVRFFTKMSIDRLFDDTGYKLIQIKGIRPQMLPWKARLINFLTAGYFEDAKYERFSCVARIQV